MGKLFLLILVVAGSWYLYNSYYPIDPIGMVNPKGVKKAVDKGKYTKYDFDSLKERGGIAGEIKTEGELEGVRIRRENELLNKYGRRYWKKYDVRSFESKAISFLSNGKKITGMMNVPMTPMSTKIPVIIMVRGFADSEGYYIGSGSWKAADKLAENGFVTVSLDFLGFGGSDYESRDILEARFEKVMSVLDLIESVKKLDFVDLNKIGIWAHSNGGQITLSVLEITGANYPTTLWAPMTNPFPQSILDTIGDDENGRMVKKTIEDFEKQYDSRRYAFENYYQWINSPIMIHQGTSDIWIKVDWQEQVRDQLVKSGKSVKLYFYRGDDHNLKKNWNEVINRDISFFKGFFGND